MKLQRVIENTHDADILESDRLSRRLKPGVVYDPRKIIVQPPDRRTRKLENE